MTDAPVIGICGWKNSGKTTLVVALLKELSARGYGVSTVKRSHHDVDLAQPDTDTFRHRQAGARQAAIVTPTGYAIEDEWNPLADPDLMRIVAELAPCDLVLVEGFKRAHIPKIEARRLASRSREPLAPGDPDVIAIAADHAVAGEAVPVFRLEDTVAIADFVLATVGTPVRP